MRVAVAKHLGQFAERADAVVQAQAQGFELRAQFVGHGGCAQQVLQGAQQQMVQIKRVAAGAALQALARRMQLGQATAEGLDVGGQVGGGFPFQVLEQHERAFALGQPYAQSHLARGGGQAGGHGAAARAQVPQHLGLELQLGLAARAFGAQSGHHAASIGQREPVHLIEAAPQEVTGHHFAQRVVRLDHLRNRRGGRCRLRYLQIHGHAPLRKGARL